MKQEITDFHFTKTQEVKEKHEDKLFSLPNVIAVGIGYKKRGGKETKDLCIKAYVEKKVPMKNLAKDEVISPKIDGINTDIEAVGEIKALSFDSKIRPTKPGYSIGHYKITAGTFGCVVRDVCYPGKVYILSNNHVLANSNVASIGDRILQPGSFDGGNYSTGTIARLSRFIPIHFGLKDYNLVDAAIAQPTDQRNIIASIVNLGIPKGTVEATLGMKVTKSGRTTQTTTGEVIAVDVTVGVNYGTSGVAYFRNQIFTTNMSKGGDSGSLLLSRSDNKATGLLFAGSDKVTVHNNITNVLMALGIEIVTE